MKYGNWQPIQSMWFINHIFFLLFSDQIYCNLSMINKMVDGWTGLMSILAIFHSYSKYSAVLCPYGRILRPDKVSGGLFLLNPETHIGSMINKKETEFLYHNLLPF